MKKVFATLLALVLVLAACTSAMAGTITVSSAVDGQTYNAYKIFDVTKSGEAYAYSITESNDWFQVVKQYADIADNGLTLTASAANENEYIVTVDNDVFDAASFAATLNENKAEKTIDGTARGSGESASITVRDSGYYFVDSSLGALCILNTAAESVTVQEKNQEPKLEKTADATTADIGSTVNYTITVTAGGKADTAYVVHDKMSDGLTLDEDSFAIKVNGENVNAENYVIKTTELNDGCTFEIEFKQTYTATLEKDAKIVITYSATLNENAVVGEQETNEAKLDYGNSSSVESTTNVTTCEIVIDKYVSGNNEQKLSGAKFVLQNAENKYYKVENNVVTWVEDRMDATVVTTDTDGSASFSGIKAGNYKLIETEAPAGYNLLTSSVPVTVPGGEGEDTMYSVTATVGNSTGSVLPTTGGIGTTIFYVVGGLLMIGALVLLITKKKVSAK